MVHSGIGGDDCPEGEKALPFDGDGGAVDGRGAAGEGDVLVGPLAVAEAQRLAPAAAVFRRNPELIVAGREEGAGAQEPDQVIAAGAYREWAAAELGCHRARVVDSAQGKGDAGHSRRVGELEAGETGRQIARRFPPWQKQGPIKKRPVWGFQAAMRRQLPGIGQLRGGNGQQPASAGAQQRAAALRLRLRRQSNGRADDRFARRIGVPVGCLQGGAVEAVAPGQRRPRIARRHLVDRGCLRRAHASVSQRPAH